MCRAPMMESPISDAADESGEPGSGMASPPGRHIGRLPGGFTCRAPMMDWLIVDATDERTGSLTPALKAHSFAQGMAGNPKSQELFPNYIEQDAKQGPSNQFAERAWSGLKSFPSMAVWPGRHPRRYPGRCTGMATTTDLSIADAASERTEHPHSLAKNHCASTRAKKRLAGHQGRCVLGVPAIKVFKTVAT